MCVLGKHVIIEVGGRKKKWWAQEKQHVRCGPDCLKAMLQLVRGLLHGDAISRGFHPGGLLRAKVPYMPRSLSLAWAGLLGLFPSLGMWGALAAGMNMSLTTSSVCMF